jgi:hypothetical protein
MMTKSCSQCGAVIGANQGFCDRCGNASTSAASAGVLVTPAKAGGSGKLILIVCCVFLLAGIAGGAWFYSSGHARQVSAPALPPASNAAISTPQASAVPGDGSATGDAAAKSKPCSLVSKEDMEKILGIKIKELATTETICQYRNDEGYSADVDTTWQGGKEAMESAKTYNANVMEKVSDLGDDAFFQAAGVMHVRKGDVYLVINSRVFPNERDTETLIARKALDNLK